jgi:hypothetical protein
MGLDLMPLAKPKPGHEAEWRGLVEMQMRGEKASEAALARHAEITIAPYAAIGAPRVGFDKAADAWMVKARGAKTAGEIAACLKEFHGHYVLRLLGPPAIPQYSNGGMYAGVDETCFRGEFLRRCEALLGAELLSRAWESLWPEEAVAYGEALLRVAGPQSVGPAPKSSMWQRFMGGGDEPDERIDIIRAAGEWYVFWGARGHPIQPWY